jgi:hypothetical protein
MKIQMRKNKLKQQEMSKEEYNEQIEKLKYLNPELCFVCQEQTPAFKVTSSNGTFLVCNTCANLIKADTDAKCRVTKSLQQSKLFTYTLGMTQIYHGPKIEPL